MAGETNIGSILRTKLHRPPVPRDHVHRPRLLEYLDQRRDRPLTLVSAAAGYGKSVLISRWMETCDIPNAWLSLDKTDSDLRQFLSYFIAGVDTIFPDAVSKTTTLVNAQTLPPLPVLVGSLANELDTIAQDFIVALDDIHCVQEKTVYDFLTELLRHPPRPMHLVLIGRRDVSLPTASLRARGLVTEIRLNDLRFTAQETASYLKTVLGDLVDEPTSATVAEKSEGWITGLRLAALAVRGHDDAVGKLLELRGTMAYVMDYFVSEVLNVQSPAIRHYLLSTSILDRFNSDLCDTLCGPASELSEDKTNGVAFIDKLQKDNLFLIALDTENVWFRYHHLFQGLLQSQLKKRCSTKEIAALHLRASEWFAKNGLIDEALQHAITANSIPYAVKLIAQHRYDLMNTEQWNRLDHWLKMLPPETVEKTPILLIARAFIYEYRSQIVESFADRDRAESLLSALQPESPEQKEVKGMIAVLHGEQHILSGEGDRAIESAERALRLLPAEALHIRSYAIAEQVLAYQMAGDIGAGLKIINEILNARALLPGITQARMMLWFCIAYWMEGDLNGLKQPALQCLKLGEQHALPESISFGRYFLGVLHYVRNELSEAERYLAAVVDDPFTVRPQYLVQSAFALARIYTPHGRDDEASNVIESVISHIMETNDTLALAVARAFQVELALRQRKIPEAQRLSEHAAYDLLPPIWLFYVPQLTPVKLLLAQNTSDSLEKAFALLAQIDGFVSKTNRKTIRIDVLALQALILDAKGKEPAAMERLTESLVLARPGGFIRNFVDMGPPMADLLKRMHRQNVAVDYIENLLAAFSDDEQVVAPESESADHPVASPYQPLRPSTPSQPLLEPLTNREIDVLVLLAQRLQNKEIADKLFVSTETVKAHLRNIYQKLNVNKRRKAVSRAVDLGILTRR
ncbi:MAG: LuxR C-terminal-related transcriptional regulator [Desulfobacterales bacterium]